MTSWANTLALGAVLATAALAAVAGSLPVLGADRAEAMRVMVIGKGGARFSGPVSVSAGGYTQSVGSRRCKVAAMTPLAVLHAAARRAHFSYKVRDYGRCTKNNASSSSMLFVYSVRGHTNSGDNGWYYKVNGRAGNLGAANVKGPFNSGRLGGGDRIVWFYCRFNASARSCQRSLQIAAPSRVNKGQRVAIKVTGCNDRLSCQSIARVKVTFGGRSMRTNSSGLAVFKVGRRGRFTVRAAGRNMIPAFPVKMTVG